MSLLTLLTTIHLFVAIFLIIFVLLQDSKGGAMGIMGGGGGGSDTVFGTGGASSFLVKATRTVAILFAISCLTLTYLSTSSNSSVTDDFVPAEVAPLAPAEKSMSNETEAQPREANQDNDKSEDVGTKENTGANTSQGPKEADGAKRKAE